MSFWSWFTGLFGGGNAGADFEKAKAEAVNLSGVINNVAPAIIGSLSADKQKLANMALNDLNTAVSTLQSVPVGQDATAEAQAVVQAVQRVVAVLPIAPQTKMEVDFGLSILTSVV